uniref:SERPIN domain-containing protein n=1 Tax=Ascaris lumbricoides TaxID=6252 RepID=A0A0M3HYV0_ASCLU
MAIARRKNNANNLIDDIVQPSAGMFEVRSFSPTLVFLGAIAAARPSGEKARGFARTQSGLPFTPSAVHYDQTVSGIGGR